MRGIQRLRVVLALAAFAGFQIPASGVAETGFGLPAAGAKTVHLSDGVGKNQMKFTSTAPLEEISGTAAGISGSFRFDPADLGQFEGRIQVEVQQMKTGISKRDGHLRSKDWLDAERFPAIVFEIKRLDGVEPVVRDTEKGRAVVKGRAVGAFSLHGVTVEKAVPFEATYILESEQTRKRAPGDFVMIQATFQIALKDFDIKGVQGLVGSRVGEVIDIQATLFGSTAAGPEKE